MVIVESTITHKVFKGQLKDFNQAEFDDRTVGLGIGAAASLFIYFILKIFDLAHSDNWEYLNTFYGFWYLVEVIGFVLIPAMLFTSGVRNRNAGLIRITAFLTVFGVILNRLNVAIFAYNWQFPASMKYYPAWMEIALSLGVVGMIVVAYKFIVNRMAIMHEHPDYESEH